MEIPKIPTMYSGHGNFITPEAWEAVVSILKELSETTEKLSKIVVALGKQTTENKSNITTVAQALKEVVENA